MAVACAGSASRLGGNAPPAAHGLSISPPGPIGASQGAIIGHSYGTDIFVSATNEEGLVESMLVPANHLVSWAPPSGWRMVTFTAPGCDPVQRVVDPSF